MRRPALRPVLGMALLIALLPVGAARAGVLGTITGANGTFEVTVTKSSNPNVRDAITITYTPDTATVNCSPIYITQTCSDRDQKSNIIQPKHYKSDSYKHLQDDMAWAGTYVDHVVCEKDPYYNGEDRPQDATSAGSSDGHTAKGTTMYDAPFTRDGSFPDGVTTITSTFEVCAVCKADGKILDCVTWTWTRIKGEVGTGSITGPNTAHGPTPDYESAVAKYKQNHQNGTVCPEEVAETHTGGADVGAGTNKKTPTSPVEAQAFTVDWDVVNLGPQDVTGVTWTVLLDGGYLMGGVVPTIGWFDFATVSVAVPGLPVGPHTLVLIVDSDYLIPEYDEGNNIYVDEFVVSPAVGVRPSVPDAAFGITALTPNPAGRRVAATVCLPTDGRATLELVDLGGRRVRTFPVTGAGVHSLRLDLGRDLAPGLYLLRLRQDSRTDVRKLTIVR